MFLRRVKMVVAYNGKYFRGFQRQKSTRHTVTTAIETALAQLQIHASITGSGRTDSGVHATGQIIHLDLPDYWSDLDKLRRHLNGRLHAIRIKHIAPVSDTFHARFDAKQRIYRYVFKTERLSLFEEDFIAHIPNIETDRLNSILRYFEGKHDFSYFCKTGSETKSNVRKIYKAHHKQSGNYHFIYFAADGFLRAQVRMMLQAIFMVAGGTLKKSQLMEQINTLHRYTTKLAPSQGLYLSRVIY